MLLLTSTMQNKLMRKIKDSNCLKKCIWVNKHCGSLLRFVITIIGLCLFGRCGSLGAFLKAGFSSAFSTLRSSPLNHRNELLLWINDREEHFQKNLAEKLSEGI